MFAELKYKTFASTKSTKCLNSAEQNKEQTEHTYVLTAGFSSISDVSTGRAGRSPKNRLRACRISRTLSRSSSLPEFFNSVDTREGDALNSTLISLGETLALSFEEKLFCEFPSPLASGFVRTSLIERSAIDSDKRVVGRQG